MTRTVLVVEDNEMNMLVFKGALSRCDCRLETHTSGAGAIDKVRACKPDLIIMDLSLPELSGLEVTRQIKADPELSAIPVVAVTAFANNRDRSRAMEGGCDDFMTKPIDVGAFIEMVNGYLA